ncbi:hypothetical protein D3C73_1026990 [compost metagenome]
MRQRARRSRRSHQNGIRPRAQQLQCLCGYAGVRLHIAFGGDQLDARLFGLLARLGQPAIAVGVGKADIAQRLDAAFLHVGKGGGNHQVFVLDHLENPAPLRVHRFDDFDAGGQAQQRHLFFQRDGHQRQSRRRDRGAQDDINLVFVDQPPKRARRLGRVGRIVQDGVADGFAVQFARQQVDGVLGGATQ